MNEKPWWLSKGVWGPVITLTALIAQSYGIEADNEKLQPIVDGLLTVLAAIGAAFGWWGRVSAIDLIDRTQVLPNISLPKKGQTDPFGNFKSE